MARRPSCSILAIVAATFTAVICSAAALPRPDASLEAERGDEARQLLRAPPREELVNPGGQGAFARRQVSDAEGSRAISGGGGDDESPEGENELWNKDHEHEKEHHEGRDGEPVSKMAEEFMNKGKAILENKKAGFEAHKEALLEQEGVLDEYIEWHRRKNLAPTLDEMMQLPSANERWSKGGASALEPGAPKVTVILNLFKREVLTEQLDSLFSQTAAGHIEEVWVCVFSAPAKDYAVRVVDERNYSNVHLIVSDYNFKFYGRFQVALTAPSDFVWLVDDDMIPGTKYLGQLIHAAGTDLMGRALLGSIGRVLPRPGRDMSLVSYRKWGSHGGKYMPDYYWDQDRAAPVDYLCSQWFLRPEWLQYMWSDRPTTFVTGEDFHVSHTMRKYANIGSYVMPYNASDEETKGSKYRGLSYVNAATSDRDVPLRDMLWMNALKAGSRMRWMDMFNAEEAHVDPSALIIVRTLADVEAMVPLVGAFKNSLLWANEAMDDSHQWKLFIFSPTLTCTTIADVLQLKVKRFCSPKYMRVFAPSGRPLDAWGSMLKLKDADPAAYEVAVTSSLREVMYTIKARMVLMVASPEGADAERLTSAAMARVTDQAAATYNEWMADEQGPVTIIKADALDMPYLEFLPVLKASMVTAWHKPKFSIHVITNDRITSLERLVTSLQSSHFLGDEVELSLHVDIDADEEMMDYIMSVEWVHGPKTLHHRIQRGGLISAVTESFHPSDVHSYAVFLEDDIEVSRGFYAWAKNVLLQYRYGSDHDHPDSLNEDTMPTTPLAGISLYTPRIEEVTPHRLRLNFKDDSGGCNALLFQTPCSWGTIYFPEVWMRLHAEILKDNYHEIPGVLVNGWSGSWKKFLFSIMYHNDWYLLYPGYTEERSFATNHMEIGVHIGKGTVEHDPKDYVVPLFEDQDTSFWSRGSLVLPKLEYLVRVSMKGEITQEAKFRSGIVHV